MKKLFIFIIIYLLLGLNAFSGVDEEFNQANELYRLEKYQQAQEIYLSLTEQGMASSDLFYNLGNVYYKINQIGRARLWYERALKLDPADKDLRANLQFIKAQLIDKAREAEPNMFLKPFLLLERFSSLNRMARLAAIIYQHIIWILILGLFFQKVRRKQARLISVLLVTAVLIIIPLIHSIYLEAHPQAVITAKEAVVSSGPGSDFSQQFTLHAGTKVSLEQLYEGYYEITLLVPETEEINRNKLLTGWIKADQLGRI